MHVLQESVASCDLEMCPYKNFVANRAMIRKRCHRANWTVYSISDGRRTSAISVTMLITAIAVKRALWKQAHQVNTISFRVAQ